ASRPAAPARSASRASPMSVTTRSCSRVSSSIAVMAWQPQYSHMRGPPVAGALAAGATGGDGGAVGAAGDGGDRQRQGAECYDGERGQAERVGAVLAVEGAHDQRR